MEIIKRVKEYGENKRQRIDINKNDGLEADAEVVILLKDKYDAIKEDILELKAKVTARDSELAILKDQEQNLKEIVEDVNAPIHEFYKKELKEKDNQIKRLEMQLKALEHKTNQHNLELMGLNLFEIAIMRKHKKLITDFNEDIALAVSDPEIIDADAKAIPGDDDDRQE